MTEGPEESIRRLEERLRLAKAENDSLAEQAEGVLLLGKVAEALLQSDDPEVILSTFLERVAILGDLAYSAVFAFEEGAFVPRGEWASFREGPPTGHPLRVDASVVKEFRSGWTPAVLWLPDDAVPIAAGEPVPKVTVALPFSVRPGRPGLLVVADDRRTRATLSGFLPVLRQMADLAQARLEKLGLLDELRILNEGLERKVQERTVELERANVRLRTEVAERRRAEDALRQAATAFENTSEGIVVTDSCNVIVTVNRAFTRITGYPAEEALGASPSLLRSGRHDRAFYDAMWTELGRSGRWQGEIWNRRKDGEVYPENLSISTVRDAAGQVVNYVGVLTDLSDVKASEARLAHAVQHDPLTGLPNRLLFLAQLDLDLSRARREGRSTAVVLLDIDRFGSVNQTLGQPAGDDLLVLVARRLSGALTAADALARFGADEFAVRLEEVADRREARLRAKALLDALAVPFQLLGRDVFVTASGGVALFPEHGDDAATLLKHAGAALDGAREGRRSDLRLYTGALTRGAVEKFVLEESLRRAFDRGEFLVHYQPVVEMATGEVTAVEALVRWMHPEKGLLLPGAFLPVVVDLGRMDALGSWVLATACAQTGAWNRDGRRPLRLSVNFSVQELVRPDLPGLVREALETSGLDPRLLELEITEDFLLEQPDVALRAMNAVRDLGVSFSIDDFGTGYSSLGQLRNLPVDRLKLDQSFLRRIPGDRGDEAIAKAVVALGHSLGLPVVAEGVEREEQLPVLAAGGCDEVQGYLLSRPVPGDLIPEICRHRWPRGPAAPS